MSRLVGYYKVEIRLRHHNYLALFFNIFRYGVDVMAAESSEVDDTHQSIKTGNWLVHSSFNFRHPART